MTTGVVVVTVTVHRRRLAGRTGPGRIRTELPAIVRSSSARSTAWRRHGASNEKISDLSGSPAGEGDVILAMLAGRAAGVDTAVA
jgi:hypothetical protein